MSYYQGDYYGTRQGYISGYLGPGRGDPGFWDFVKGVGRGLVGMIPGIGPVAQKVLTPMSVAGGMRGAATTAIRQVGSAIVKHPVVTAAGAAAGVGMAAGAGIEHHMAAAGAACPKGFHPCKSKHGCKKGPCVRNRRMNVCNPRALRRAARRAHGFLRISRRLVSYYTPKKHRGKAYIRKPRKRG